MTTTLDSIELVDFSPEHLQGAVHLSQMESWPHRAADWALNLTQSRGVVAVENGIVVGTALASLFEGVATLNMIIVAKEQRGRRLGRRLMEAVIAKAGARELRLIATQEGLPLYEKMGFEITGKIEQLQGVVKGQGQVQEPRVKTAGFDIEALAAMDRASCGCDRKDLLRRIAKEGQVFFTDTGFAILRDFGRGKVLGPIVAQNLEEAQSLLAAAADAATGTFLRIDTPVSALADYAKDLSLAPVGGGTCMTMNAKIADKKPEETTVQTYGLVSQALG